jgi:hypothetical protein
MHTRVLVYSAAVGRMKLPFGLGFKLEASNMILFESTACSLEFTRNKKLLINTFLSLE